MSNEVTANDVIVADNDYIVRGILRSILDRNGFSVLQAVDGLEALDYATRTLARLVILDVKMPKLDGFAACSQIRRLAGYTDVPIAMLTAFDGEEARTAARRSGATAFFAKPFKPVELLRGIALLVGALPADGGMVSGQVEPVIWKRYEEPAPLYGESAELSEGRRVLNICRR